MSFEPHRNFTPPSDRNAQIWRYGDLSKLLSLLDRSALFFPRLDALDDPFEGLFTKSVFSGETLALTDLSSEDLAQVQIKDEQELRSRVTAIQEVLRTASKQQREVTFINSWHCQEYESAAMWVQYLKSQEGIAVQSTYTRLAKCFDKYEDFKVRIGLIKYIDYETEEIPEGNLFAPVLTKRRSFEHERELRAVIWTMDEGKNAWGANNRFQKERGIYVPVDLNTLIERISVAPTAPPWIRDLVASITTRFGFDFAVHQSKLAGPAYY